MSTRLKLILGLLAIFAAGLVVGASVGFTVGQSKLPARHAQAQRTEQPDRDRDRERGSFTDRMCARLQKDLALSQEQLDQIRPIVEETSAQVKALNADNYDRVRAIFRASHQKMKPFLSPEQVQKLEEKNRERDMKFKKGSVKPPC